MRAYLFYPLVALAAGALIAASLGPTLLRVKPAPQAGRVENGEVVFDADALAHIDSGPDQVSYVVRDDAWRPTGVQIATKRTSLEPSPALQGAQLLLDPHIAAQFAGKPLLVTVRIRPVPITTAAQLAASAQAPGPVDWRRLSVPPDSAALSFHLPAIEGAPQAIGFWPIATARDYDYGIEIDEVRVSAAP